MSRSVTCYPQPGKERSRLVLEAFAAGCGGSIAAMSLPALRIGAAAFYGLVGLEHFFVVARAARRDWYYGDNSFFDRGRGRFFRFARNAFQLSALARPDHGRLRALGISPQPWRTDGRHIVVVEQSEHFLRLAGAGPDWLRTVTGELARLTDRPLRIRGWRRDKDKAAATLQADLAGAWALVTHMSAAANEALLAGVPVICTGPCAASPLARGALADIERPLCGDGREGWAAGLAAMQWTLDELRAGMAWKALHD